MSLKNHPNFHAIKFVTDVSSSFYESLRGGASIEELTPGISDQIQEKIVNFVAEIENIIDQMVSEKKKQ